MIILVTGINVTERDPWGGILDTDDLDPRIADHRILLLAIAQAEQDKACNPNFLCGTGGIEDGQPDVDNVFKKLPWTGTIEEEVIIFVE